MSYWFGSFRLAAAFLICAGVSSLFAQSNATSGQLQGTISDVNGGILSGVAVIVTNDETGLERAATTDVLGIFRVLLLPAGTYDLAASLDGFQSARVTGVRINVGQIAIQNITLELGTVETVVEVTGAPLLVESERSQQENTLLEEYVEGLPIDRRDYLTFSLLAPGVVDSNALADNADFRVAQTPTSGLSFYGSNGRGNSVSVDGGEADDGTGGVRLTPSQDAIAEFQINRSNFTAEFGGASGGTIHIITKTGTNDVNGTLFGFFRNDRLDASNPFASLLQDGRSVRVKPPSSRQQYGGSIGGPLARDKTFFFFAAEALNRDESSVVSVLTDPSIFGPTPQQEAILSRLPDPAAISLRRALSAPPSTRELFAANDGVFPFSTNSLRFNARLDHSISSQDQLLLRYNFADQDDTNQNLRALVGASRGIRVDTLDSNTLFGWTRIFGPSLVNELRAQVNYGESNTQSIESFGPELNINGYGFFNRDIFLPSFSSGWRYEIRDNLTYYKGNHSFKFGGSMLLRQSKVDSRTFFGGRFTFGPLPGDLVHEVLAPTTLTALQAFNLGLPITYQQGFGDPVISSIEPTIAGYALDRWKVRQNLTLDIGLRYEIDDRRDPIRTDRNNFAPRFGFAWDPFSDGKTTVRGGYGIFYSPIYYQVDYVVNALAEIDGFRQIAQAFTSIQTPGAASSANIYGTLRAQGVIGIPKSERSITAEDVAQFGIQFPHTGPRPPFTVLFEISPDFANPYAQQASLGIERQITQDTAVSASYTYVRTLKITRARDRNLLPAPIDPSTGIRTWNSPMYFQDPLLAQLNVYESTASAFYSGLILEVKKRFSNRFSFVSNYTFSRATDEVVDYNSDFQAFDQTNLRAERALSSFDQRHKFVAYGVWNTPANFEVSPILRANSGRPFNLLAGVDVNQDRHSTTDRPPFAGRNTGMGPNFFTFDLRVSRRLNLGESAQVQLIGEAFNLFNRQNFAGVNNTVGLIPGPFNLQGRRDRNPSQPLGFTSIVGPRRFQLGVRLSF